VATTFSNPSSSRLKVWIITPHDAVIGDVWGQRHARSAAEFLSDRGHAVTYWAASFSHAEKKQRGQAWTQLMDGAVRTILVPVRSYSRNVSFARMLSLRDFASNLEERLMREPAPDVILATAATPFVDGALVRIADRFNVPLICDFRDLWPELFETAAPRPLRRLIRLISRPFYKQRSDAIQRSTAVAGTCKEHLEIACRIAPHLRHSPSIVLYQSGINADQMQQMMEDTQYGHDLPIKKDGEVWITYAGTIGNNYDIQTLVAAAKLVSNRQDAKNLRIVVAGDGPLLPLIEGAVADGSAKALKYVGSLDLPTLARLYARSDVSLSIYSAGSTVIMPAKAYDLFAAGLPILNSLQGEFMNLIEESNLGLGYRAGDSQSLANAMLKLANDSIGRAEMRRNLLAIAPQYDRDRQYAKVVKMIETVVANSRAKQDIPVGQSQSR
jgi:glycosyltransferase involved in cell wall biosynthesis